MSVTQVNTMMLATGIDCSSPKVQSSHRRDELAETGRYERWRGDFALCRAAGPRYLCSGPPYYKMHVGPHTYGWF